MKRKAIFLLYRVLQALASPVVLFYLVLRGLRNPKYFYTLPERCGVLKPSWQQTISAAIWLHAVSVGEVVAAAALIEQIKKRAPETPIFLSTATLAGKETAGKRLSGLADGVFYAPFDFVWCVRRVLRRLRPTVVVILETEIWPNLFHEAKRIGCGLIMVNGRISDRALPRYRRFEPFFSEVLALCDRILVQSSDMKARFEQAGAPPAKVEPAGNLKYDLTVPAIRADSPAVRFIEADSGRPLWIAASTSADDRLAEEDFVIEAQRKLAGWRSIIAPRKPERFEEVAGALARSGLRWTRRSAPGGTEELANSDVLLLDSIGELSGLFPYATVVFMGGTLADRGGHNILEPAMFGKPVIAGPHMENFREIADHFEKQRAVLRIESGEQLHDAIISAGSQQALGERARSAAEAKRGASVRAAEAVLSLYETNYPCERHAQPIQTILWLFSLIWQAGSALDRSSKKNRAAWLPVPVVSVGNVTAGGTGKTPVTIELLREFHGVKPGLLTRGYGRATRESLLILNRNLKLPLSLTGDEAQLYMRSADAPIGIGADRLAVGRQLLRAADVQALFLDDGFQHRQLHRDFDLVLIDGLRPFGGGNLLPLGRLREPLHGLSRASALLLTRADETPNIKAIETVLRQCNPTAPVFHARTVPRCWRDPEGKEFAPEFIGASDSANRMVAFCGLGNPQAFWRTLRQLGIEPLRRYEYDDHHQYTPSEIRRLAQNARDMGADTLLTTAKDAVNLDPDYRSIIGNLKLFWLEIGTEIDRRGDLLALIAKAVTHHR